MWLQGGGSWSCCYSRVFKCVHVFSLHVHLSVYYGGTRYTWRLGEKDRVLDLELQVVRCEQLLGAEN